MELLPFTHVAAEITDVILAYAHIETSRLHGYLHNYKDRHCAAYTHPCRNNHLSYTDTLTHANVNALAPLHTA